MQIRTAIFSATLLIAGYGGVAAQSSSNGAGPAACAPTEVNPRQGTLDATPGQSSEPLGNKLARTDGVLCPPTNVDPDMRVPAPNIGTTPVIPPPGSPGGDPSVRPK